MSRIVCLAKKMFGEKKISPSKKEIELYDAILFNYEGEKRADIVTSIETFKVHGSEERVYGTCVHGLIKSTSVERNLGTVK
jgi:hypothetical protein